jgi:hypothetical protein
MKLVGIYLSTINDLDPRPLLLIRFKLNIEDNVSDWYKSSVL